jgi:hypothetical protein
MTVVYDVPADQLGTNLTATAAADLTGIPFGVYTVVADALAAAGITDATIDVQVTDTGGVSNVP